MLGKYAAASLVVVESIDRLINNLEKVPPNPSSQGSNDSLMRALLGKEAPLQAWLKDNIKRVTDASVSAITSRIPMPSVSAQARRLEFALDRDEGPTEIKNILRELRTRIFDELNEREFLHVPPTKVRFFKETMLFGKEVNDRFPHAIDDIEEAGKCLALGRATACVLHTMRILEVGLKALAGTLNIPYAPSWESYLKQISDNIAVKHKNKTAKWKQNEKFYRDLSGDLLTIKQVWRNPTMHVDRKYGTDEAEQIFNAARIFMERLALHLGEKEMNRAPRRSHRLSIPQE